MQIGNVVGASLLMLVGVFRTQIDAIADQTSHILHRLVLAVMALPNAEWSAAAVVLTVVSVTAMFLSGLIPKERFASRSVHGFGLWEGLKTTLLNANYRRVIAVHVAGWIAGAVGSFFVPYLPIYWVQKPSFIMPLYAVAALSGAVALPIWVRLGRVLEKSVVLRIVCVNRALMAPLALVCFSRSHPYLVFVLGVVGGVAQAGTYAYVLSMIGDVTDEDEVRTGQRREGMYFGVYTLSLKLVNSLGLLWTGFGLALVGYVPNAEQSMQTLWGMRLIQALPELINLSGLWFMHRYPLNRARLEEIHRELANRKETNVCSSNGQ